MAVATIGVGKKSEDPMFDRLVANLQLHAQALELRAERHRVLSSNIANADTPGYKARDFDFQAALRAATGRSVGNPGGSASVARPTLPSRPTLAVHGAAQGLRPGSPVSLAWRVPEQASLDGNTVDLDRERANFADNALRYEATLRFANGNFRTLLTSIRGD